MLSLRGNETGTHTYLEREFAETLDFVTQARFLDAHIFAYSRRPGTPAASYDGQVDEAVKRERSAALIEATHRVRDDILSGLVAEAEPLSVVLETKKGGVYHAHSDTFVAVCVQAPDDKTDLRGTVCDVIPIGHENGVLLAKLA